MTSRIFTLAILLAAVATGCSSMKSPTYTADTLQKIRLHDGSTSRMLIVREDPDSLHAVAADENVVLAIPREHIASITEFPRRRQMLAIDIGVDPLLSYYREVAPAFVLGASARYRSPLGFYGRYQFSTGPADFMEAIELSGEPRYHLLGGAMRGFYIAPSVGYAW